ncbi:MAG TPA: SsgA family sporulation/cell division regulator [Nocardioidaceae bacterium]|nr:SsgA family sporulation/cell division regulator [Nocardioidaceae bacterium]
MNHSPRAAGAAIQRLLVELIEAEASSLLEAELVYHADDPYAVTAVFSSEPAAVRWRFSRDLLIDGVDRPTGLGDVHLRPCLDSHGRAVVIIELHSMGQEALIQARASDLRAFVDRITELVPPGSESQHLDVDAAVAALLVADRSD